MFWTRFFYFTVLWARGWGVGVQETIYLGTGQGRGKNLRINLDKIQKNSSFPEDTFSILTELQISFECKCSVIASKLFQCTLWTLSKNCAIVMLC